MPRDSSGNYTLPSGNPVVGGTPILADGWANPTFNDLANEMTNSLDRQGRGGMLAAFRFVDGTEAAPGMSWTSEPGTGLYRANAGDMRATVLSQDVAQFASAGLLDRRQVTSGPDTFGFFRVASSKHFQADSDLSGVVVDQSGNEARLNYAASPRLVAKSLGGESLGSQFDINNSANADAASLYFRNSEGGGRLYSDGGDVLMYFTTPAGGLQDQIYRARLNGSLELNYDGSVAMRTTSSGIEVPDQVVEIIRTDGAAVYFQGRNNEGGFRLVGDANTVRLRQVNAAGSLLDTWLLGEADGKTALFFNDTEMLRTSNNQTNDIGMGAQVKDGVGAFQPVGMNITPINAISTNQSLRLARVGHQYRCGAALTITIDATTNNAPDGAVWVIANEGGANVSLNVSGGPVLTWLDGAGGATGNRTLADGGYVTITKRADNQYQVVGNGLS